MEDVYCLGPFFEGLLTLVGGVYLFYSRQDEDLRASKVEKELRERATRGIAEKIAHEIMSYKSTI